MHSILWHTFRAKYEAIMVNWVSGFWTGLHCSAAKLLQHKCKHTYHNIEDPASMARAPN